MPASLNEVKRRISSTKKTAQITTAMQMVSTSKLSRIQQHTGGYQDYISKIKLVMGHLLKSHLLNKNNVVNNDTNKISKWVKEDNDNKKIGLIVITSDRGLVGSYNSNVIKLANDFIKDSDDESKFSILALGNNAIEFYNNRDLDVSYTYRGINDTPTFSEVKSIVKNITKMYDDGKFSKLYVCYSHFVNRLTSKCKVEQILPISEKNLKDMSNDDDVSYLPEYDIEPSPEVVFANLLPQYVESLLYGIILDSKTSEHASSSTAMKTASDNANDLIDSLNLQYNRARQSAITTEITEITGGQAALE